MYKLKKTIEIVPLGDEEGTVLFDSETGNTYVLNYISADILDCLNSYNELNKAVDKLAELYNTDKIGIQSDVIEFIEKLESQGLFVSEEEN